LVTIARPEREPIETMPDLADALDESPRRGWRATDDLNRIAPPVEFGVFVESALAGTEPREGVGEQDGLHPFHLLEAQLDLVAQANRRSVFIRQWFTIHLVRENGLRMVHALGLVNVVEQASAGFRPVCKRDEDCESCLWFRANHRHDVAHRRAAPLGNTGP